MPEESETTFCCWAVPSLTRTSDAPVMIAPAGSVTVTTISPVMDCAAVDRVRTAAARNIKGSRSDEMQRRVAIARDRAWVVSCDAGLEDERALAVRLACIEPPGNTEPGSPRRGKHSRAV